MYVVSLVSRLPMQIVEETVTYGWPQGTSPYLVVTIYSKCPPCLKFAVYTGYMLPRRLRRLDALLARRTSFKRWTSGNETRRSPWAYNTYYTVHEKQLPQ